jgi:amidase
VRSAFYNHLLALFEQFRRAGPAGGPGVALRRAQHWPRQVAGRTMDTYHRWMEVTIYATFAGLPAISVPAGFDAARAVPMGLQLIGRPQADAELLRVAAGYEALIPALLARRPPATL